MSAPDASSLRLSLAIAGYETLPSLSGDLFCHRGRAEVLRVATQGDAEDLKDAFAQFLRTGEFSRTRAGRRLVPEILEVGESLEGSGFPFLRERYVSGENMGRAYARDPTLWDARLADGLAGVYAALADEPAQDVGEAWERHLGWHAHLAASPAFDRFEHLYTAVREVGLWLRDHLPAGRPIHGDMHFGNILARDEPEGTIALIDWDPQVMPLAYEAATLYTFMVDPRGEVERDLRSTYGELRPLRSLWERLAPRFGELGVTADHLRACVVFRMGRARVYFLDLALRQGADNEAAQWSAELSSMLSGTFFDDLPLDRLGT